MSWGPLDIRNMEKKGMGDTPEDIMDKCLKLCQTYLAGVWLRQTTDTITVKRLTGGMLNQLYYCSINAITMGTEEHETVEEEEREVPQEVAIKLIQKKPFLHESESEESARLLAEKLVTLMVSEEGLGPKVYGIFEGGVIFKYYSQEPFNIKKQVDEGLVREVFEKLARIHSLEPPIERNKGKQLNKWMDENYEDALEWDFIGDMVKSGNQLFIDNDYHKEIKWIKEIMKDIKSPVVFTHNDYRSDNLMVLTDGNKEPDGKRIIVCDYEFSIYAQRGADLVHIIREWGNHNAFFDRHNLYYPPEEVVLKRLFQYYFDESVRIFGEKWAQNPVNSVEHLIKELKVFWLKIQFSAALPLMKWLDPDFVVPEEQLKLFGGKPPDKSKIMKMADNGYDNYLKLKNKLINEI